MTEQEIRSFLLKAIFVLCAGKASLHERLRDAYTESLRHIKLNQSIAADFRVEFARTTCELEAFLDSGSQAMPEDATEMAKRIVALYQRFVAQHLK